MSAGQQWLIEDLPEPPPVRRRRIAGHWGLSIVLAALLAVAVTSGLRPRLLGGNGDLRVALALPVPGQCLRWDVDTTAPPAVVLADPHRPLPVVTGSITPSACVVPHQGQVVQVWRQVALEDRQAQRRCVDAGRLADSHFPVQDPSGWSVVHGDRRASMVRTGTEPTDYVACVLIEIPSGLPPALFTLNAPMTPDSDAGPRWCLTDREQAVGCGQRHRFERIGIADEPRGDPSCSAFAEQIVGLDPAALTDTGLGIRSGMLPGTYGPTWFCDVVAPTGQQLTASVVGLGTGQLPIG